MMWWDDAGWNAGGWILMSLLMIVFWGGLVALVVWLVRGMRTEQHSTPPPPPPAPVTAPQTSTARADELLAERFARGEIDEHEFTRRRALLHPGTSRV
jgi:putative membrane protein